MYKKYVNNLILPTENKEVDYFLSLRRRIYNGLYPFKIFPQKGLNKIELAPITIFYGGNGSGKSTLLNVIAEKAEVVRHSAFSKTDLFSDYVGECILDSNEIPSHSQILTIDDVSDYLLNVRYLNLGLDVRRVELIKEYVKRKNEKLTSINVDAFDDWQEYYDAKHKPERQFVNERLMKNADMKSNGESAMKYFVEHITEDALYLLDEPENSLSIDLQLELKEFIEASSRHFGCQFIIASHSPVLLSIDDALIYNLDTVPVQTCKWTELENVRKYFDFFEKHRSEFI